GEALAAHASQLLHVPVDQHRDLSLGRRTVAAGAFVRVLRPEPRLAASALLSRSVEPSARGGVLPARAARAAHIPASRSPRLAYGARALRCARDRACAAYVLRDRRESAVARGRAQDIADSARCDRLRRARRLPLQGVHADIERAALARGGGRGRTSR